MGSQGFQLGSHHGAKGPGENITHPSPISISLGPAGRVLQNSPNQESTRLRFMNPCAVWSDNLELRVHQLSISRYTGKEKKVQPKGQHCCSDWVTFWMSLLSGSSLSKSLGISCPSTQKWGTGTTLHLHKVGEKRKGWSSPLGDQVGN